MDQKDDEEISIDFSKIKKFFGNKEEKKADSEKSGDETKQHREETKSNDEVDLSFDFGKIRKFFKSEEKDSSSDDVNVDWSKISAFFKTYGIVFIALIPIILSIYIRMQAGFLPLTDDWAANSVISNIRNQVRAGIDQQYPNLPSSNKDALVNTELQKVINQNKQQIDQQVKATSAYIKSFFQDENGKNYMPDIDPYYWFRYSKNILDHGYAGDILVNDKSYDTYQNAPNGRFVTGDMFPSYFLAYFYRVLHIFAPGLDLMRSMFYYPVFVSALIVLLVFLISKKIAGTSAGFFAGLMMAINSAFLGRTLFGHADSDAWVVFFPVLVTWLFVITIDAKSIIKIAIITVIAGFFTGLFTYAWSGWWYIFDFLLATIGITFLCLLLVDFNDLRKNIKSFFSDIPLRNLIIVGIIYFISTALFVTLFFSASTFTESFLGPLSFKSIKEPVSGNSLWPNVLTTVAELNEGSINGIVNSIGGYFFFYISLIGLLLSISKTDGLKKFDFWYNIAGSIYYAVFLYLVKAGTISSVYSIMALTLLPVAIRLIVFIHHRDKSYDFKLSILLALWIVSTIFASIKGIRFTLLLAPAFSVAFGVALGKLFVYSLRLLTKELKIHKAIGSGILIFLFLFVFFAGQTKAAISAAGADLPLVNDAWYKALTAIKQDSKPDAIITSWWDFGHHFKAIADRRVSFDGTTQTYPQAHWVGELLMIDNENKSAGILRMMDCAVNNAYNLLYKLTDNNTHLSLKIIEQIVGLDKKNAEKKLKEYKFEDKDIQEILAVTHCQPSEAYFIASDDMVGKSGVWSHFGSWNFERADIWQNARKMPEQESIAYMMKKFNYSKEKAQNVYSEVQSITSDSEANSWVAPWPGYAGTITCSKNGNGIFVCPQLSVGKDNTGRDIPATFYINMSNYDVFGTVGGNIIRANPVAFTTENGIYKKQFEGSTVGLGFTIIPASEDNVLVVMSSPQLVGSMFTRMFYMQGHGLRYFKLLSHQKGLTGTDVYVYKVDWEGKNTTIVDTYVGNLRNQTEAVEIKQVAENESNNS